MRYVQGLHVITDTCFNVNSICVQVHIEIQRCWYRRRLDGYGNKIFTVTTAVRHNSSFGVRNSIANGRDGAGPRGKFKREVASFKDFVK